MRLHDSKTPLSAWEKKLGFENGTLDLNLPFEGQDEDGQEDS
jgi:hypothetical protein